MYPHCSKLFLVFISFLNLKYLLNIIAQHHIDKKIKDKKLCKSKDECKFDDSTQKCKEKECDEIDFQECSYYDKCESKWDYSTNKGSCERGTSCDKLNKETTKLINM